MSVTTHDPIEMVAGETWQIDALLLDAAGDAIDLTGATVTWTLNDTRGFSNVLTRTTGGSGVVVTNEDAGLCTITVTPELSVGIAAGTRAEIEHAAAF